MDLLLKDKVAVVTGAVGGIGEETARILHDEGAKLVLADIRDDDGVELAKELDGLYVHTNVLEPDQINAMIDKALESYGTIDILVNTVGLPGAGADTPEGYDRQFQVHVRGVWSTIVAVTERVMIPNHYGKIVNIASLGNHSGVGGMSAYGAAKAAIAQITHGGARDLGRKGINMNCVSPGNVYSPMTKKMFSDPEIEKRVRESIVFGYVGDAKDIAWPIVFLCSDRAKWIVGADVNVSAGQVIY